MLLYQDVDDAQCTFVYAFLFVLRLLCVAVYSVKVIRNVVSVEGSADFTF